ncbi:metallophosphoesterase family protein [Georgenia sp. H159]|uniref:metallophosphoesterase family protein n=1 Tax=Georgenia sp. H159 TaxID=3076115 RepID=UPI002D766113|nr:metallophosphoesterase family protein [Georgenia sp. H159]
MPRRPARIRTCALGAAAALALTAVAATPGAAATDDFRVQPYLQSPSTTSMLVNWFSWEEEPGALEIPGREALSSVPELQEHLDWTENNRQQAVENPEWGDWFREGRNYRHQVLVEGLEPGTEYEYTVRQGDSEVTSTLTTAPSREDWEHIRFTAMSDSETEPAGRVTHREWVPGAVADGSERPSSTDSLWAQTFGTQERQGELILQYALTEDEGFAHNMEIVAQRDPDLMLFAGDLVQGGGFQPAWDEWFRHLSGEVGQTAQSRPVVTALGNWEPYGASDGAYTLPAVIDGRASYRSYFTPPSNGTPEHQSNYHRVDYGPLTIVTLDSTKGVPDDHRDNYPEDERLTGREYTGPGADTQSSYTSTAYEAAGGTDLSPYNEGGVQWAWAEEQLADAREQGQIVVVQFHHAPYSSGEHGLPMNHEESSGQGGTPMRAYSGMLEEYGVAAVISGHSEMFERSYVDADGDGLGLNYYDVGVAGDGLRGERHENGNLLSEPLLEYNPYRVWSADQSEPEVWDGERLVDGGKHYGHLEVNVERSDVPGMAATMTLTPVYSFPLLAEDLTVLGTERRTYDDEVVLAIGEDGTVLDEAPTPTPTPTDEPTPTQPPSPAPTEDDGAGDDDGGGPGGDGPGGDGAGGADDGGTDPTTRPAPSAGGNLPSTGAPVGLAALAALALLGAGLLLRGRRGTA